MATKETIQRDLKELKALIGLYEGNVENPEELKGFLQDIQYLEVTLNPNSNEKLDQNKLNELDKKTGILKKSIQSWMLDSMDKSMTEKEEKEENAAKSKFIETLKAKKIALEKLGPTKALAFMDLMGLIVEYPKFKDAYPTANEIERALSELEALTRLYEEKVGNSEELKGFLQDIKDLGERLKPVAEKNSKGELDQLNRATAILSKSVQSWMLDSLDKSMTEKEENAAKSKFIETLKAKKIALNNTGPTKALAFMDLMGLIVEYPKLIDLTAKVAKEYVSSDKKVSGKKRKTKASPIVEIAEPPKQPSLDTLKDREKEYAEKIDKQREVLDQLIKVQKLQQERVSSSGLADDQFIKQQLTKIEVIVDEKLKQLLAHRDELYNDLEPIRKNDELMKGGCDLHLMSELPKSPAQYKNSYIFIKKNDTQELYYIKPDGGYEKAKIIDFNLFEEKINAIKNKDETKLHLREEQIKEIITSNGGHQKGRERLTSEEQKKYVEATEKYGEFRHQKEMRADLEFRANKDKELRTERDSFKEEANKLRKELDLVKKTGKRLTSQEQIEYSKVERRYHENLEKYREAEEQYLINEKRYKEVEKKYDELSKQRGIRLPVSGSRRLELLIAQSEKDLDAMNYFIKEIENATNLITERLAEIDQIKQMEEERRAEKGSMVKEQPLVVEVPKVENKDTPDITTVETIAAASIIPTEESIEDVIEETKVETIKVLTQQLEKLKDDYSLEKEVCEALVIKDLTKFCAEKAKFVSGEEDVQKLLVKHEALKKELDQILKARDKKEADLNKSWPPLLGVGKLSVQIPNNQQAIDSLRVIKNKLTENVAELDKAIDAAEELRISTAKDAASSLRSERHRANTYIEKIEENPAYKDVTEIQAAIRKAKAEMADADPKSGREASDIMKTIKQLESAEPGRTTRLIPGEKEAGLGKINDIMSPLQETINMRNKEILKVINGLEERIAQLEKLRKEGSLSKVKSFTEYNTLTHNDQKLQESKDQPFNDLADIRENLARQRKCNEYSSEIVNWNFNELSKIQKRIKSHEVFAHLSQEEIKARDVSKEAVIVRNMISSLDKEINKIQKNDPRMPILEGIKTGLQTNLDDYMSLKTATTFTAKQQLIEGSLKTLETNLTSDKLRHLSDAVVDGLTKFARFLLQPITSLIKAKTRETYRPHFFATDTETNVGNAAENAHRELQTLHKINDALNKLEAGTVAHGRTQKFKDGLDEVKGKDTQAEILSKSSPT